MVNFRKKPNLCAIFDKFRIFIIKTVKIKTILLKEIITKASKYIPLSKFGHFTQKIGFPSKLSPNLGFFMKLTHGITKYGIHSFTQITLAMDKELMN